MTSAIPPTPPKSVWLTNASIWSVNVNVPTPPIVIVAVPTWMQGLTAKFGHMGAIITFDVSPTNVTVTGALVNEVAPMVPVIELFVSV